MKAKENLGVSIPTSSQLHNIAWSDRLEKYKFAQNTKVYSIATSPPFETIFNEKPRVPMKSHLKKTRD